MISLEHKAFNHLQVQPLPIRFILNCILLQCDLGCTALSEALHFWDGSICFRTAYRQASDYTCVMQATWRGMQHTLFSGLEVF